MKYPCILTTDLNKYKIYSVQFTAEKEKKTHQELTTPNNVGWYQVLFRNVFKMYFKSFTRM